MGRCSSCGHDLPGSEQLCHGCHLAQYGALTAPNGSSSYSWSVCIDLLLWISVSYALLTYLPGFAKVVVLGVGFLAVCCLDLWAFSQRPWKRYGSPPPERLSFILAVCCGVVWKITGADVWFRLGGACILVSATYRAARIATDLAKTAHR
jgi:hypothetical protein